MADLLLNIRVKASNETGRGVSRVRKELDGVRKSKRKLGDSSKDFLPPELSGKGRGGAKGRRARKELKRSFSDSAQGAADLGRAAENILEGPIDKATRYETALTNISTLSDNAEFSTSKLRDITKAASLEFGGTSTDQAGALYDIISAGASTAAEANATLAASNKLAIGGLTSTSRATDAIISTTANFRKENIDAAKASDLLFSIVQSGKTTLDETARAFPKVASAAGGIELEAAQAAGAFATLTLTTKSSAVASTQFASLITSTTKATEQRRKTLRKLNREREKGTEKIDASSDALKRLGVAGFAAQFKGIDDKTLSLIFGSSTAKAAVVAFRDNIDGLNKAIGAAKNSTGEADKAFAKQSQTRAQRLKIVQAKMEDAELAIGEAIAPIVDELTPALGDIAGIAGDLAKEHPGIIKAGGALAVGAVGFGKLGQGIVGVTRTVEGLQSASELAVTGVGKLSGLVGGKGPLALLGAMGAASFAVGTLANDFFGFSDKAIAAGNKLFGAGPKDVERAGAGDLAKELKEGGKVEVKDAQGNVVTSRAERQRLRAKRQAELVLGGQGFEEASTTLLSEGFTRDDAASAGGIGSRFARRAQEAARSAIDVKVSVEDGRVTARIATNNHDGDVNIDNGAAI